MPFNRHFGFIFLENDKNLASNPEKLQHTIAHELGHGAFTLYHTFSSKDKSIPQGSTYNLMDYSLKSPNNLLRKYQWHTIHNPRISLFGGEEEEVSEETGDYSVQIAEIINQIKNAHDNEQEIVKFESLKNIPKLIHGKNVILKNGKSYDIHLTRDPQFIKTNINQYEFYYKTENVKDK